MRTSYPNIGGILSASDLRALIRCGGELINRDSSSRTEKLITLPPGQGLHIYLEGSAYDLTVDRVERVPPQLGTARIGVNTRNIPYTQPVEITHHTPEMWTLRRGQYLIISTETVAVPWWVVGWLSPRTSFARAGHCLLVSAINPNYHGTITALLVVGRGGLLLERGARFCALRLMKIDAATPAEVDIYKGIWGVGGYQETTNGETTRGY